MTRHRRPLRRLATGGMAVGLLVAAPARAEASPQLVESTPRSGSVVAGPLHAVVLRFAWPVDPADFSVAVWSAGSSGSALAGRPSFQGDRTVVVPVRDTARGWTTVDWSPHQTVKSPDMGQVVVIVTTPEMATAVPLPGAPPAHAASWPWLVAGVAAALVAAGLAIRMRRRPVIRRAAAAGAVVLVVAGGVTTEVAGRPAHRLFPPGYSSGPESASSRGDCPDGYTHIDPRMGLPGPAFRCVYSAYSADPIPAQIGARYPFTVGSTHCGVRMVQFDGRLFVPETGMAEDPFGMITLVSRDQARFEGRDGNVLSLHTVAAAPQLPLCM